MKEVRTTAGPQTKLFAYRKKENARGGRAFSIVVHLGLVGPLRTHVATSGGKSKEAS
ncbi:hypothetical protein ACMYR2_0719 [Nitrobacter sp. TKz-YC01]